MGAGKTASRIVCERFAMQRLFVNGANLVGCAESSGKDRGLSAVGDKWNKVCFWSQQFDRAVYKL